MDSLVRHFFDVPVYRLPEKKYYEAMAAYVDRTMHPDGRRREFYKRNPELARPFKEHLQAVYGGEWIFNEIIGYIRLHFFGSDIRGEYFSVKTKRVVRTRRKVLEWKTHKLAPEVWLSKDVTNAEIAAAIREYLADCKRRLPGRYIDTEIIDRISPYVDWRALMGRPL